MHEMFELEKLIDEIIHFSDESIGKPEVQDIKYLLRAISENAIRSEQLLKRLKNNIKKYMKS